MRRLWIVACLVAPSRVGAQLPPIGVPGGVVRLDLDGSLETFDRRFLHGNRESYAADLSSPALGSDRIPSLADADARVGRIIGNASYRLNLGGLAPDALADVGRGSLGLSLGLTDQITIFGSLPLVRTGVQPTLRLNTASADAGLNPGVATHTAFFGGFDAALATLSSKLAAGDYDADPARLALAQATLTSGTAIRADLFGLLADPATASPAVPISTSSTGAAVLAQITGLQNTLASSLDVPGFTAVPSLPPDPLGDDGLGQILAGSLQLRAGQSRVTFRGDAEAGAALTLIDRWDPGTRRGGFRLAVSGLVRFPTGQIEQTDQPLDIGTGDGQTDIQVDAVADLGAGRFGVRLGGSYVRQLASDAFARVTRPSQPFVGPDRLASVRRDPGDLLALEARPFFRLARTFALQVGVQHWTRSADQVSYSTPGDVLPGVDASLLAEESEANATALSVGITYANPGRLRPGGTGLPVDATWSYERVLRAGGGLVPDSHAVRGSLRVYFGLW
ncbi:MAG TPA: hypothetical protein VFS51_05750 [Gemmatimonadales bacterium]|nr:hypothetical protein [Gemmatimonadales bacterium]